MMQSDDGMVAMVAVVAMVAMVATAVVAVVAMMALAMTVTTVTKVTMVLVETAIMVETAIAKALSPVLLWAVAVLEVTVSMMVVAAGLTPVVITNPDIPLATTIIIAWTTAASCRAHTAPTTMAACIGSTPGASLEVWRLPSTIIRGITTRSKHMVVTIATKTTPTTIREVLTAPRTITTSIATTRSTIMAETTKVAETTGPTTTTGSTTDDKGATTVTTTTTMTMATATVITATTTVTTVMATRMWVMIEKTTTLDGDRDGGLRITTIETTTIETNNSLG